jgi:hypothetical protein
MTKQSKSATSEDNQKVEVISKEKESAKTENIENPEEKEFNLTEEQWAKVFQHPRFTQLNEKAKEAEKLEKERAKELQEKLKEEGKYKELLEASEKR